MQLPAATYRLQFNAGFTFADAQNVADYLSLLGADCIYASPVFKAHKGSSHGYDIIDPNEVNPEIGSEQNFRLLVEQCRQKGLLWLQDIVPNHMAYSGENKLIVDILENGSSSRFIDFFDIAWDHPYESLRGKLLAPFLGKFYGTSLEDGEIRLAYDESGLAVNYYELRLPLRIESYVSVFGQQLSNLKRTLGADHPDFIRLLGVLYSIKNLLPAQEGSELQGHIAFSKRILWELYSRNRQYRQFVDENIEAINGIRGNPDSFNLLEKLLSEQLFRLSFWKVAAEEINYRRFFNINELISLRVEDDRVFQYVHSLAGRLVREGIITGLRIDHIDGLYDPAKYLVMLREAAGNVPVYVEKILAAGEELPENWPVQGTTGYDFLNEVNGLFCRRENESAFTRLYHRFIGYSPDYRSIVVDKKRLIIGKYMAGDIDNLAQLMKNISNRYRYGNDITIYGLKRALVDVLALFPVYRTYISLEHYREFDRIVVQRVLEKAREYNPGYRHELDFIETFLLLNFKEYLSEDERKQWLHFVMRFQQFTGPLMAKGYEDTVLYVYNRLISLNEVGGNPNRFGITTEQFHDYNHRRAKQWPHSLIATATHDTKRGEDARARINVISEMPTEWRQNVKFWSMINDKHKVIRGGHAVPGRNDEYFLYQSLVGSFPFRERDYASFIERIKAFMIKAVREAKIYTAWIAPDGEYENGFLAFIEAILRPEKDNEFLREFMPFQKKVADFGVFNSLSQTLIKITSPGIPDFYQGTELWDLSLVDPDNRRPVDFVSRRELLDTIIAGAKKDIRALIAELLNSKEDGRIKLFLIHRALQARRALRHVFECGRYIPIQSAGRLRDHVIAYARRCEGDWAVTITPRFMVKLFKNGEYSRAAEIWRDTRLTLPEGAPSRWRNALTGAKVSADAGAIEAGKALEIFPAALLVND